MSRADPLFKLRLPDPLRGQLEAAATANHRSLTAEILRRLEESLTPMADRINALEKRVFDEEWGNEALYGRIDDKERELSERISFVYERMREGR